MSSEIESMTNNIHTDKPATVQSEDCFQRYEFSKRIASIVAVPKIDKSLIIGLYGKWGEGKTTVLNFIRQELPEETIVVNFNPWLFSDEQHVLKSFFNSITEALGAKDKTLKEKLGGLFSDYGGAIGSITQFAGFSMDGVEKLGNKLKEVSTEQLKKRVDDLIIQSEKNIVVFVDDIDRLDIQEIQYIFKLVKLVGDFPRTCYVLSFDEEMVSAALAPKYGGDNKTAGYNFLEKIIQLPLKIPKASKKALYKYTMNLLNNTLDNVSIELDKEDRNAFSEVFNTAFLPFMDNPRLGVRYANTLSFAVPLLKGEVNIGNLMALEGIKIFYPELYDFIRHNSFLFLQKNGGSEREHETEDRTWVRGRISTIIGEYKEEKRNAIIEMLESLFPQLKVIYSNTSYPESAYTRWEKEKRICSGKYFDRYFSYTVQEGDIPDNYFNQLLAGLQNDSIEDLVVKFTQAIEQYDSFWMVQKFRSQKEDLNELQAENLAMVIAKIGYTFPIEEDMHFATTYAQSAILIAGLVKYLPKSQQLPLTLKLLSEVPSFEYAMEINYWLMYREKNDSDKAIFTEQDEAKIQEFLVAKFQKEVTDETFFTMLSDVNLWRILSWWSKWKEQKNSLKSFWDKHLQNKDNLDFALKLLKVFTPTISSFSSTGEAKTYKSGFYKNNYISLKEVVDVQMLNKNLVTKFGMKPYEKEPSTVSDRDPIDDKTLVSVFQWFIVKKESPFIV
jgi:predicted KAP-like P-loop ATPase